MIMLKVINNDKTLDSPETKVKNKQRSKAPWNFIVSPVAKKYAHGRSPRSQVFPSGWRVKVIFYTFFLHKLINILGIP